MKHAPPEVRCSLEACGVVWWQRAVGVWRVQKIFLESTGVSCGISGIIAHSVPIAPCPGLGTLFRCVGVPRQYPGSESQRKGVRNVFIHIYGAAAVPMAHKTTVTVQYLLIGEFTRYQVCGWSVVLPFFYFFYFHNGPTFTFISNKSVL